MATTAGLPPLPPPSGHERLERVAVRRLQHSYCLAALPHEHKRKASETAGNWPDSQQRRKTIQLTRYYDKLSQQYQNSLSDFHTSTHAQDDEDARVKILISHARSSQPEGTVKDRSPKCATANTLAAQRQKAQMRASWQRRDFDKSFAIMADIAMDGKILNSKDQLRPTKRWSKTATAATIKHKLLLTKGALRMAGGGKPMRMFNGFGWTTSKSLLAQHEGTLSLSNAA